MGLSSFLGAVLIPHLLPGEGNSPVDLATKASLPGATDLTASEPLVPFGSFTTSFQSAASGGLAGVIPAVVRVSGEAAMGSGVLINPSGLVLTSAHLVGDSSQVRVVIEGTRTLKGRVTRLDATRDLALVQLPPGVYPWANLASDADLFLGAPVFAIGYPINLPGSATITQGIVSRLLSESSSRGEIIQTDADINRGNSGGPLVDSQGRLVGIVTTVLAEYQSMPIRGIGFAVSIKTIREELLPPSQATPAS